MMIGLETEDDVSAQDLGVNIDLGACKLVPFTFYNIDFVSPYRGDSRFSLIGCCGDDFVVNCSAEVVNHKISQINALRFN